MWLNGKFPVLWLKNTPTYIDTPKFFIHLPVSRQLGCFHVSAILSNVAMYMTGDRVGVGVGSDVVVISLMQFFVSASDIFPEVELLDRMVVLLLIFFNLLIYFWLRWILDAACRLSLVWPRVGTSWVAVCGLSLWCLLLLQSIGYRACVGFSSCGPQAKLLKACGIFADQG